MKLTKVDALPKKRHYHHLKDMWEEFMAMNTKFIEIELYEGEYSSINVARTVMYKSIKRFGYPIDLVVQDGKIYLIRRDI